MSGFMHSFEAFKKLALSIPDQRIALQLKQILSDVKNQTVQEVQTGVEGFVAFIKTPAIRKKIDEAGKTTEVFKYLEQLCSDFAVCIEQENPALAAGLQRILEMPIDTEEAKQDRIGTLYSQLDDKQFIAAFSAYLKSHLTPTHLNREEHIQSVLDEVSEREGNYNRTRVDQSIYDPERDLWRQLWALLFTIGRTVGQESIRTAKRHTAHEPQGIQFRPMPS